MTWTAQLAYAADGLTDADTAALSKKLKGADIAYTAGRLRIQLEVKAPTLQDAIETALRTTATATGLLKPSMLCVQLTEDYLDQAMTTEPQELIGITEIAKEFGVTRQRAAKLADAPDFPQPVAHPASGRIYTRESIKAFQRRWEATRRTPAGGRPRRQLTVKTSQKATTKS